MTQKPLEIDCVAGSQLRDSQGETLSIEGCDISALEQGTAKWTDNHGKGFFHNIGRITYGKKIFKAEDCENDRQKYYWDNIKAPFIYAKGYLYNDDDHPNARAAAAVIRNIHRSDCPLKMKASVEGGVISRGLQDPTFLSRTKLNGVALTLTPANHATLVEPLNLNKTASNWEADLTLIKSVLHLAQDNIPSFRHITRTASAEKIETNLNKIADMLGMEIPWELKQSLIEDSLSSKIEENVSRINELVKTAGYNFSHEHHPVNDGHITKVNVHSAEGNHIGAATFLHQPDGLKLSTIAVDDDHQRRGLGRAILNHAQKVTGKSVNTSTQQTPEGAALWESFKPKALGKALTAGYGGAGVPTNSTGGAVMQRQSLDTGPKGFRYIACDNCGKEQIYGKFQVRCREPDCGKSFSMAKLEKFFRIK